MCLSNFWKLLLQFMLGLNFSFLGGTDATMAHSHFGTLEGLFSSSVMWKSKWFMELLLF